METAESRTPTLALTANAMPGDAERGITSGRGLLSIKDNLYEETF